MEDPLATYAESSLKPF